MRRASLLPTRPWLGAHRVHIRPSRAGLAFALLLLALWIAAVNYQLALGHALTWFAVACAITDMLFASRNLAGLTLSATPGPMVAAGDKARFELRLINRSARPRHAIAVLANAPLAAPELVDVDAGGAATSVTVLLPAGARGWLQAPAVRLSSNFPLGLFHAWCHWQPEAPVLVYPRPEQPAPALPANISAQHLRQAELAGVAAYQSGDPLRRLAWRHIARHDDEHLYSKQFEQAGSEDHDDLLLDYAALPPQLDREARLSRLCAWLLAAEHANLTYGLRLEQTLIAPGQGPLHLDACLRALALHGLPQASP